LTHQSKPNVGVDHQVGRLSEGKHGIQYSPDAAEDRFIFGWASAYVKDESSCTQAQQETFVP
jgi:hypothetical protein